MVVLIVICNAKADHDLVKKAGFGQLKTGCRKIVTGLENQFILTGRKFLPLEQWSVATAIRVGDPGSQMAAATVQPV